MRSGPKALAFSMSTRSYAARSNAGPRPNAFQSITPVGIPRSRARASTPAPGLLQSTATMRAPGILPSRIASAIAAKLLPRPEAKTTSFISFPDHFGRRARCAGADLADLPAGDSLGLQVGGQG